MRDFLRWHSGSAIMLAEANVPARPVINDKVDGYRRVNVAQARRDPQSILNWTERVIRARKECPEISWVSMSCCGRARQKFSRSVTSSI